MYFVDKVSFDVYHPARFPEIGILFSRLLFALPNNHSVTFASYRRFGAFTALPDIAYSSSSVLAERQRVLSEARAAVAALQEDKVTAEKVGQTV